MATIYHITTGPEWKASQASGEHRAESLATEGFIHCSKDEEQLLGVARRLFMGQNDLLALEIDTNRLTSQVKHEPSKAGDIYPHIYGPINNDAVVGVRSLKTDAGGNFFLEYSHSNHP